MRRIHPLCFLFSVSLLSLSTGCNTNHSESESLVNYVDPFIGTGDHGHVFMGANVPWGFVQLGPTQMSKGWDWCSGYHYSDSTIVGFAHTHLSGTGIGDLGDIAFMPVTGDARYSLFSHKNEVAQPGYYQVYLDRNDINVELTATQRAGYHRYKYPESENPRMLIDVAQGIGWDSPREGFIQLENDTVVSGYRVSKGWANRQEVFFTAVFSQPITGMTMYPEDSIAVKADSMSSRRLIAALDFAKTTQPITVKVGISAVSIQNARLNLQTEVGGKSFDQVHAEATAAWEEQLGKIKIKTNNTDDKKIFYTALYHSMIAPSVFCDVNGEYRGSDGNFYRDTTFTNFTTFSLWDTYRAAHPLATIIHPEKQADYARTFLNIYQQQGKLPVWHLVGNETNCMVGNPGIPVLADMLLKGVPMDTTLAYEAMKQSALKDERSLKWIKEYGYIPYDLHDASESVAKALEYALADWCIAQVAAQLGKEADYALFSKRAKAYQHYFDKNTNFVRGKSFEGAFREPFNPFRSEHRVDDYTEGNAWQYTWLVPHDVKGLIAEFGSEEAFTAKLDSLFIVEGDMGENASVDITGLIGQYAHGNEPSHHITYMYPYVGQQWKTAARVREILTTLYHAAPAGLCGNEDVGQMSAWYILSSMGFYQVKPAGGEYIFGSPLFDEAEIAVGNGRTFRITAHNNSRENCYIQRVTLNGKPYTKTYIRHADIVAGGVLEFEMGNQPSAFGTEADAKPI